MGTDINKLNVNGTTIENINANGTDLKLVRCVVNGTSTTLLAKAFSFTVDTSKLSSLTCDREISPYAGADTGNVSLDSDFYWGDKVAFDAKSKGGYYNYKYYINGASYEMGDYFVFEDNAEMIIEADVRQLEAPVLTRYDDDLGKLTIDNSANTTWVNYSVTETGSETVLHSGTLQSSASSPHSVTITGLTRGTSYTVTFTNDSYLSSSSEIIMYSGWLSAPTISYRTNNLISVKNPNNMTVYFTTTAGSTTQSWISKNGTTDITGLSAEQTITVTLTCDNYVSASADLTTLSSQLLAPIFNDEERTGTSVIFSNPNEIAVDYVYTYGSYSKSATILADDSVEITGITASTEGTAVTTTFSKSGYISASATGYTLPQLLAPVFVNYYKTGVIVKNTNDVAVTLLCSNSSSTSTETATLAAGEQYTYTGSSSYGGVTYTFKFSADGYADNTLTHDNASVYVKISWTTSDSDSTQLRITNLLRDLEDNSVRVYYNTTGENTGTSGTYIGAISAYGSTLLWSPPDNSTYYIYSVPNATTSYYPQILQAYVYYDLKVPTITCGESNTSDKTYFTVTNNDTAAYVNCSLYIGSKPYTNYWVLAPGETSQQFSTNWYSNREGESELGIFAVRLVPTSTTLHYNSYGYKEFKTNMRQLYAPTWSAISSNYTDITVNNINSYEVYCYVKNGSTTVTGKAITANSSVTITGLDNSIKYSIYFTCDQTTIYMADSAVVTNVSPTAYPALIEPVIYSENISYYYFKARNMNSSSITVTYTLYKAGTSIVVTSGTDTTGLITLDNLDAGTSYTLTFSAPYHTSASTTVTTLEIPATLQDIILTSVTENPDSGHVYATLSNPNDCTVDVRFIIDDETLSFPYYHFKIPAYSSTSFDTYDMSQFKTDMSDVYYELVAGGQQLVSGSFDLATITSMQFIGGLTMCECNSSTTTLWISATGYVSSSTSSSYYVKFYDPASNAQIGSRSYLNANGWDTDHNYITFTNGAGDAIQFSQSDLPNEALKVEFYSDSGCTDLLGTWYTIVFNSSTVPSSYIYIYAPNDLNSGMIDTSSETLDYVTITNSNNFTVNYAIYSYNDETTPLSTGTLLRGEMTTLRDSEGNTIPFGSDSFGQQHLLQFTAISPYSYGSTTTYTRNYYFIVNADGTFTEVG